MTNVPSQSHKSRFKGLQKSSFGELQKFPLASFHKCIIGLWCLTPRRQVFVFPFLKPKVGLFRFSQADYSHIPAPEEEKILVSLSPPPPGGSGVSVVPPPPTRSHAGAPPPFKTDDKMEAFN